jgi:2,3-diketo-5-methylthio-1-phosphopentane phosphatase
MGIVLICDFDGTILNIDTLRFLLEKFTKGNWRIIIKKFEQGEITLEECLNILWSRIRIPKHILLRELEKAATIRSNLNNLINFCRIHDIPFIISSAGLDFIINHFLDLTGSKDHIEIVTLKTKYQDNRILITFPKLLDTTSIDFKEDLVKSYKRNGYNVVFIGDGISDYNAALNADFSFTIKDSDLTIFCKKRGIPHQEITDFEEVYLSKIFQDAVASSKK